LVQRKMKKLGAAKEKRTSMGLLVGLLLLFVYSCDGSGHPPKMPLQFVATFTNPVGDPLQPYTGTWYYDWTRQRQRVDGGNQASCNRVQKGGQYCTTYLTSDSFYVAFPFTKQCVKSSAPGLLYPDWLAKDNATYVGQEKVGPRICDVWLAMGSDHNYWLQDRAGFPCKLDDGGFNWTFSSFQAVPVDPSITEIPAYCQ
jgi:hypothetical protein